MPSASETAYLDVVLASRTMFWAGIWPPLARMTSSTALFDPARDHRLPPDMHGRFEVVLLLEYDLAGYKQWPVILDEALRLLRRDGVLVLRFGRSPLLSVFALKNQLLAWTGGAVEPVFEFTTEDGHTQMGVRLALPERERPRLSGFTFALISDGRRPAGIDNFIGSVRALRDLEHVEHEILVCGPPSIAETAASWGPDCRIVDDPGRFAELGWITHKKNLCVRAAAHENVVLAHDRYVLAPDFLVEMAAFGADFDVLVCRQVDGEGDRFPDWVTLGSAWGRTSPAILPYGEYCRNQFVNGGLMIAKRDTLGRVGWNELLFWEQAEDVELTRRFQSNGIVPRLARNVVAVSTTARPGYVAGFETFPLAPGTYFLSQTADCHGETQAAFYRLGTRVGLGQPLDRLCAVHGVRLAGNWSTGPLGATLAGAEQGGEPGEVFLRIQAGPDIELELALDADEALEDCAVRINGEAVAFWRDGDGRLRVRLGRLPSRLGTLRMTVQPPDGADGPAIRSLELGPAAAAALLAPGDALDFRTGGNGPPSLAEGWSGVEDWGIWSIGPASAVYLPLRPAFAGDEWLEVHCIPRIAPGWDHNVLGLALDGIPVGHVRLGTPGPTSFRFALPDTLLSGGGPFRLSFHPRDIVSPASLGIAEDTREIALGLQRIVYLGPQPA